MDKQFQDLFNKIRELDAPVDATNECMEAPMDAPGSKSTMNVNINAQGMDDIQSIMSLFQKVNPDMMPQGDEPMPTMGNDTMMIGPADIDALNSPPDKDGDDIEAKVIDILGDEGPDADDDAMVDPAEKPESDEDSGENPFDSEGEEDEAEEEEAEEEETDEGVYANSPDEKEASIDTMVNQVVGGLNDGSAKTYPKVAGGDNPMQKQESFEMEAGKGRPGSDITPDKVNAIQDMDLDAAKVYATELVKKSSIKDKPKLKLMQNIARHHKVSDILQALYNVMLARDGHGSVTSDWRQRMYDSEDKNSVDAIKEDLRKQLNAKKGITEGADTCPRCGCDPKSPKAGCDCTYKNVSESVVVEGVEGTHDTWFETEAGDYYDVEVFYNAYAGRPAKLYGPDPEPEEHPEMEIWKVVEISSGKEIPDEMIPEEARERWEEEIWDEINTEPDEPEYDRYESSSRMQELAGISQEVSEDYSDTFEITTDIELDDGQGEREMDLSIEYSVSGSYRPATWGYNGGDPAEYPEIDIEKIIDLETGNDIYPELIGTRTEEYLREKLQDHLDDYEPEPDYDWESSEAPTLKADLDINSLGKLAGL